MSKLYDSLLSEDRRFTVMVDCEDLLDFTHRIMDEIQKGAVEEMEQKKSEEYLDRKAVRDMLKICDTTLWKWGIRGKLVPQKVGARNVYRRSDVMAILDGKR